ncbi:MAG: TRAP transporter large permease [Chloroflexi bacterium]|nr:TRAP transporter large permease [Chloroflexota bacterium]
MSPEAIGGLLVLALVVMLLFGVNIAIGLGLIGLVGVMVLAPNPQAGLGMVAIASYSRVAVFSFSAIPLFILMGELAFNAGISSSIFSAAYKWLGSLRGGMAMATVAATAAFGAVSGSTIVAAVSMTKVAWSDLMKYKYDKGLCAGALSASGGLAILIPPSIIAVFYGLYTETPVGAVLLAGVVPGILTGALLMLQIFIRTSLNPKLAPPAPSFPWKERFGSLKGVWGVFVLAFIVTGGLYGGIFTASEAAAAGAFGAFVLTLLVRALTWRNLYQALLSTTKTTSFIFFIIVSGYIFSKFLGLSNLSNQAVAFVGDMELPRVIILIGILSIYFVLGMFLEGISMLALTISTVFPIILSLGYDPVWFGIVIIMMVETAAITPPVGLNVFAVKAVLGDDVTVWDVFKNALPFLATYVGMLALIIMVPQVALWLPSSMTPR